MLAVINARAFLKYLGKKTLPENINISYQNLDFTCRIAVSGIRYKNAYCKNVGVSNIMKTLTVNFPETSWKLADTLLIFFCSNVYVSRVFFICFSNRKMLCYDQICVNVHLPGRLTMRMLNFNKLDQHINGNIVVELLLHFE